VADTLPTQAMLETAQLVDALSAQVAKASGPVVRDCLNMMIEIVYAHQPLTGGYQPPACRCGAFQPCADYQRARSVAQGWGLI
jgi:hypothetical protein